MRKASAGGREHEAEEIAAGGDARQLNASIQMSFAGIAPDGCRMVRPRGFARQRLRVAANTPLLFGPGAIH